MDDFTLKLIMHLLEEEERDEAVIALMMLQKKKRKRRDIFTPSRRERAFENLISRHLIDDETKFQGYFRLTREQFDFVLSAICEEIETIPTNMVKYPISPKEKLAVTLRYLATGQSYRSLALDFRISHSAISTIVKKVLSSICDKLAPVLLPLPTKSDFKSRALEFWERWNFPNCVGAIDGKHVRIICSKNSGSLLLNNKNYFSIVLLAIVDAKYKFLAIDVGSYGKEGDSSIFSKSSMGKRIYSGQFELPEASQLPGIDKCLPHVLVADEAFRLHTHIMKPYNKAQAQEDFQKDVFNRRLSQAQQVSKNAFSLLSQFFRVFCTPIAIKLDTCDSLITAACCLHNLIRDGYETENVQTIIHEEFESNNMNNMLPFARHGGFANAEGFQVRDGFKSFFSIEGQGQWQDQTILGP